MMSPFFPWFGGARERYAIAPLTRDELYLTEAIVSLAIAAILSLLLLIMPVYSSGRTLVQVNGPRVFAILAIPVIIAASPIIFVRLKLSAAIAMFFFSLVAVFSIGLLYLPSAVLLAWPERPRAS